MTAKDDAEQHQRDREARVTLIRNRVDELIEPHVQHSSPRHFDEEKRKYVIEHVTLERPALLDLLADEVGARPRRVRNRAHPESIVPINVPAFDKLLDIRRQVDVWFGPDYLDRRKPPASTKDGMRELAQLAPTLRSEHLWGLDDDTRRWHGWAEAVIGWDDPAFRPHVACVNCERFGTLRVRLDQELAMCMECGEVWDQGTFGLLARYYRGELADAPVGTMLDKPAS